MKEIKLCQICQSRYWWAVMLVGFLMVACGIAYWMLPMQGYVVASRLFGWLLVGAGVVQLVISSGNNRPKAWGWWLVGGVLDIFVGFLIIQRIGIAEMLLPYLLAVIFLYWGVTSLVEAMAIKQEYQYWWIKLLNGVLMLFIGFFFLSAGFLQDIIMVSTLASLAFIYWGIILVSSSLEMRHMRRHDVSNIGENC